MFECNNSIALKKYVPQESFEEAEIPLDLYFWSIQVKCFFFYTLHVEAYNCKRLAYGS